MEQTLITLKDLSVDEINAILIALQELPGKICNPLSKKIQQQVLPQIQPTQTNEFGGQIINKSIDESIATVDKVGA